MHVDNFILELSGSNVVQYYGVMQLVHGENEDRLNYFLCLWWATTRFSSLFSGSVEAMEDTSSAGGRTRNEEH